MLARSKTHRLLVIGLAIAAAAGCRISQAATPDKPSLAAEIHKHVASAQAAGVRLGVQIVSLGPEPGVVYAHQADTPLKPASNQKLITAAATLDVLGPTFTYRTILARRGDDLVIIGAGDPSIGDPRLAKAAEESITALFHKWADQLQAKGIASLPGDLLFDDSIFDQQFVPPSWPEQHSLEHWYTAPVGGLNFNDNCVDVLIKPAAHKGETPVVSLIPSTPFIQLVNNAKTAAKGEPTVRRTGTTPMTIEVSGVVSRGNDPDDPLSIPVTDPGMFFASTCRTVLASHGIKIAGTTRRCRVRLPDGRLPPDLQVLATHQTKPADILWRLNKSSQNVFAEAFLKSLAAYAGRLDAPGTGDYEAARKIVRAFVQKIGASPEGCVFDDGCGLSHTNRATAAVLTAVLAYMDRQPLARQWRSSLAVPGEDVGTLRHRMKPLAGSVLAKTGYIRGVSALSGYVDGPDQRRYAFSVLCNDTDQAKGGSSAARKLQEAVCQTLATWPNPSSN